MTAKSLGQTGGEIWELKWPPKLSHVSEMAGTLYSYLAQALNLGCLEQACLCSWCQLCRSWQLDAVCSPSPTGSCTGNLFLKRNGGSTVHRGHWSSSDVKSLLVWWEQNPNWSRLRRECNYRKLGKMVCLKLKGMGERWKGSRQFLSLKKKKKQIPKDDPLEIRKLYY